MSIQQSVNQSISGSLFLLNQTDYFQRLKAIRDAKREVATRSEINKIVGKADNESTDASQKVTGEKVTAEQAGVNTSEGNPKNNMDERVELARRQRSMFEDMMQGDMYYKLYKRAKSDIEAQHKSEEFRKKVMQGVYRKEDRWDGK